MPNTSKKLRTHCVSVRLNNDELQTLIQKKGSASRAKYLREAAFNALPPIVPPINIEVSRSLIRAAGNLNQIAKHLNTHGITNSIDETYKALAEFRRSLMRKSS